MDELFHQNQPPREAQRLASRQRHITIFILGLLVVFNLIVSSLGLLSFLADYNETKKTTETATEAKNTAANVKQLLEDAKKESAARSERTAKNLQEAYGEIQRIFREEVAGLDKRNHERYLATNERLDALVDQMQRLDARIADLPPPRTEFTPLPKQNAPEPPAPPGEKPTIKTSTDATQPPTRVDYPGQSDSRRNDLDKRKKDKK